MKHFKRSAKTRILSLVLAALMCFGTVALLTGCGGNPAGGTKRPDALVIMTEELDGLFNPFYSTTAADGTIVSMTQIGMLGSKYENNQATVAYGDDHAVAVKDFMQKYDSASDTTTYTFVLKNGIKFSDGHPLTMEDVLFNMYVYLDPVYTGSSTMYSTDIVGLTDYRTQKVSSGTGDNDSAISEEATTRAKNRIKELLNLFMQVGATNQAGSYSADYDKMVAAINAHSLSSGYKDAVSNDSTSVTVKNLLDDYNRTLELFKKELGTDYVSASSAYTEEPYKSVPEFANPVFCFMYAEGYVDVEYEKDPVTNKDIKSKIKSVTPRYSTSVVTDKDSAINYVYNSKIESELHIILQYWATAQTLITEYTAKAKEVILHENLADDGSLAIPNISGIVSLGHTSNKTEVVIGSNTYKVAKDHNTDGTVKNADEYDVLEITINGVDPKAIWNFAFSVAPQHYYAEGYTVDIKNNKFGVDYGSFSFMTDVIQSPRNIKVPMGAGAYVATDVNGNSNPEGNAFFNSNIVYFKRNDAFLMGQPKIELVRYQVVSASNALDALETGAVHFVTPQFTQNNITRLDSLKAKGFERMYTKQLGYGYIGINAGKVADINLRKAIMSAMNISLALSYYSTGMAENIYWPMSTVSWAYPTNSSGNPDRDNLHSYPALQFSKESAMTAIKDYMAQAGVTAGDSKLEITFTIAGSNLTDHPTYETFRYAAEILNECGWDIEVVADTQALTKLSTGSLSVWAAAWGSTIDPDMYQVYHKNSTATSVLAWGYREILANEASYPEENKILNDLSRVIDEAREIEDQKERAKLYKEAMGYVLDLAVELPVYQRMVLYAYNSNVIDPATLPADINPYSSPLDHIWELDFAK